MTRSPIELFWTAKKTEISFDLMLPKSPVWLLGLPPVVEAEHDGEGTGRQQLFIVVIVQAVGLCQRKSVANLSRGQCRKL